MHKYEDAFKHTLSPCDRFIVRVNGSNFKALTHKFPKANKGESPFDSAFVKAMALTARDLLIKFNCATAYVHYDEISLVFNRVYIEEKEEKEEKELDDLSNEKKKYEHIIGGKIEKIISEIPSYTSMRFCYHLKKELNTRIGFMNINTPKDYNKILQHLDDPNIMFDGRLFTVPTDCEIGNYFVWRSVCDCFRNCVSTYLRLYESDKSIQSISTSQRLLLLESKHNVNENSIPFYLKYGIYMKRMDRSDPVIQNISIQSNPKVCCFTMKIACSDDVCTLLLNKRLSKKDTENESLKSCNFNVLDLYLI